MARTAAAKGSLPFETLPLSLSIRSYSRRSLKLAAPLTASGAAKTSSPAPYRCAEKVIESACVINTASASYAIARKHVEISSSTPTVRRSIDIGPLFHTADRFSSGRLRDLDIASNAAGDIVEIRSALVEIR